MLKLFKNKLNTRNSFVIILFTSTWEFLVSCNGLVKNWWSDICPKDDWLVDGSVLAFLRGGGCKSRSSFFRVERDFNKSDDSSVEKLKNICIETTIYFV